MTKPKVTKREIDKAAAEVRQVRGFLLTECQIASQTHDKRLVMYAAITAAIQLAWEEGWSPGQFAELCSQTIELYTRERDDPTVQ